MKVCVCVKGLSVRLSTSSPGASHRLLPLGHFSRTLSLFLSFSFIFTRTLANAYYHLVMMATEQSERLQQHLANRCLLEECWPLSVPLQTIGKCHHQALPRHRRTSCLLLQLLCSSDATGCVLLSMWTVCSAEAYYSRVLWLLAYLLDSLLYWATAAQ